MFLLPEYLVEPLINPFYLSFRANSQLLGFWPCSNAEDSWTRYFSIETERGRVVPVFYEPSMIFDDEDGPASPALFFMGCDDGHLGIHFKDKKEANEWLASCPYVDFDALYRANAEGKLGVKLHFHN